jgi:hypothetical protein
MQSRVLTGAECACAKIEAMTSKRGKASV